MWYVVVAATCAVYAALAAVPAQWVDSQLRRCGSRSSDGLDVKGVIHSSVVGAGAIGVTVLEAGLDVVEPARSYICLPPTSMLAWALPLIELGYALHDLLSALRLGNQPFIVHSVITSSLLTLCCCLGVSHHMSRVLVVHISTVFLHLRRVDFGPIVNSLIDVCFAVSFWALRLILLPWWWYLMMVHATRSEPSRHEESNPIMDGFGWDRMRGWDGSEFQSSPISSHPTSPTSRGTPPPPP